MAEFITLSVRKARSLIFDALTGAGTSPKNAVYFTEAILDTELSGLEGHGFYWLYYYCLHLRCGKVDGRAKPKIRKLSPTAFMVDANRGFAHPAIEKGFKKLIPAAKKNGIAAMGVAHSYNAATLGYHTGVLAKQGLLAFGFTNSIAAIAPYGGKKPIIGTNPMSFAVPGRKGKIRFLIDQSSSQTAWTSVKRAAEEGHTIPLGWALDRDGIPTTNPNEGLDGSMAPAGGYKGFSQGLIVEVLCAALTGSSLGTAMGSFTDADKAPIDNGQFFIAIEPKKFAKNRFDVLIDGLVNNILDQEGTRLPNARREENQRIRQKTGLPIERELLLRLRSFYDNSTAS
jgi:(2R)-3-sulfolactate dehydrogenase (NADP+)